MLFREDNRLRKVGYSDGGADQADKSPHNPSRLNPESAVKAGFHPGQVSLQFCPEGIQICFGCDRLFTGLDHSDDSLSVRR